MTQNKNKHTILKILPIILFFSIIYFGFVSSIFSNNIIRNTDDEIEIDFYFLESEFAKNRNEELEYINGDLTILDFQKYDGKSLPKNLNVKRRMYTFRGFFYLDEKLKYEDLALMFGSTTYPYNVYLNGKQILKRGRYKKHYNSTIFSSSRVLLPKYDDKIYYGDDDVNELAIQIFPIYETQPFPKVILSSYDKIATKMFIKNFFAVNFIQGVFIINVILFIYFMLHFFTRKFKDKKHLYFALTCIIFVLSINHIVFHHDSINELLSRKVSILCFSLSASVMTLFILEFTKIYHKKIWLRVVILLPNLILSLPLFLTGSKEQTKDLFSFSSFGITFPLIIFSFYILFYSLIKKKHKKSIPLIISYMILVGVIAYDMFFVILELTPYVWLTTYGFFSIIMSIFFILAWEQSQLYVESVKYAGELKRLNEIKDEFLSNTSHELRTPLNGIVGIADSLISRPVDDLSKEEIIQNLTMIVSSGRRLSTLINDILDYSKLKNRDVKLKSKSVSLKPVVDVVLVFSEHLIKGKNLKFENNIESSLPNVYADEDRLQQIFYNLLGNAIKFTNRGMVSVDAEEKKDSIVISVTDTGIGIPKHKLDDVFKSFEQINGSISREYGGTGLGLSITKNLIELQGGTIWVESDLGQGSKFTFTLPKYSEKYKDEYSKETQDGFKQDSYSEDLLDSIEGQSVSLGYKSAVSKNKVNEIIFRSIDSPVSVLVVDDDAINVQVINNNLSIYNWEITNAYNGETALKKLREKVFDIVLLDVMMPKISGYDVCRKIRENYSAGELPVIMLTAKNQIFDITFGFESGANDYLTKPISKDELLARLNLHLELSRANLEYKRLLEEVKKLNETLEKRVLERTSELEDAYKQMESFSYSVSHDLKNPLSIIGNCNTLLKKKYSDVLNDDANTYIHYIEKNVNKISEIIEGLLMLSRVSRREIEKTEVNLSYIVREISETLTLNSKEQKLQFKIQDRVKAGTDSYLIKIVLQNLIGNAFKYSGKNKDVKIEFGVMKSNNDEVFFVRDNGVGFDMKYVGKIFEPFERLHKQSEFEGSGIGLATVYRIIKRLDGKIWAESIESEEEENGKLTTFYFTINSEISLENIKNKPS